MIPGLPQTGAMELIIILIVILLFFGAKRIPSLARSLGGGIREFRKGASGGYESLEESDNAQSAKNIEHDTVSAGQKR